MQGQAHNNHGAAVWLEEAGLAMFMQLLRLLQA